MRVLVMAVTFAIVTACADTHGGSDAASTDASNPDGNYCGHPAEPMYSCAPLPAGSPGCSGPAYFPLGCAPYATPSTSFALDCLITLPCCNPYYPSTPEVCRCVASSSDGGTSYAWACGL